jgi:uncharacterized membrane protein
MVYWIGDSLLRTIDGGRRGQKERQRISESKQQSSTAKQILTRRRLVVLVVLVGLANIMAGLETVVVGTVVVGTVVVGTMVVGTRVVTLTHLTHISMG